MKTYIKKELKEDGKAEIRKDERKRENNKQREDKVRQGKRKN